MCGIAGFISLDGTASDHAAIEAACDRLSTRGPDDRGLWREHSIALGHRRLAILDLSSAGHQPMFSADQRYAIVHNGEIYNFPELRRQLAPPPGGWRSDSDTEVILAAYARWGAACVQRLHGMFAFAIWDRSERTLFAARDRMGVKPFYYAILNRAFAFASRPRALWAMCPESARTTDEQALRWYLEAGYIPAPHSIHQAIRKLPPGHHLTVRGGDVSVERYWDFRDIEPQESWSRRSEEDLLDELDELLSGIVRGRMLSDVPVGAFLSGGIDSSLVVAMMARHSAGKIRTFTIGFEEQEFDESAYADRVARHIGTDHVCETLTVDSLLDLKPVFMREYDEPFFDSSSFPLMAISRLARRDVTVVLTGDGADELFGGYHYYEIARWMAHLNRAPAGLRRTLSSLLASIPRHQARLLAGAMQADSGLASFAFSRSISKDFPLPLSVQVLSRTKGLTDLYRSVSAAFPRGLDAAAQSMRLDAALILPDDYLQKVDLGSMAFSLEARDPFLDHRLVEWAMRLPTAWKLRGRTRKYLLRKLAYRYIPQSILDRPKMGFAVPLSRWLRGPLRGWAAERIEDRTLFEQAMLDQTVVRDLFHLHLSGAREVHPLLWAALTYLDFVGSARPALEPDVAPRYAAAS